MAAYEPHIDGLRGIAITAVLFFHCGFASAGHGFLGVDVFFVISGYLITGLLLREAQQTGSISLRHFYLRRARRLLPNLFALLLVTGLAAPLFMNHEEVAQLGKSLIATTVYLSNVFFYRQSGYFSPAAEELPLLHTWSLAVEEQFYFVWPAIILGCCALWRGRDNFRMLFVVAAIGAASAIFFAILDTPDPDASFYFSPARVWQFAAGALLAIARPLPAVGRIADRQSVARKIAVGCAVVVLGYVVTFGARTEHDTIVGPLAVVAATVTLLAMCRAHGQGIVARALQSTFANFLGKTSYSVYLWHWPVIVFYRFGNPGAENNFDRFFCLFLSIGVGVAAYYLVEAPIRRGQRLPFLDSPIHALVFFWLVFHAFAGGRTTALADWTNDLFAEIGSLVYVGRK